MTTSPRAPFVAQEHGAVGAHLEALANRIKQEWPDVEIGTSSGKTGGGEIALCFCRFTAYVRKHVRGDTWNFNCRWPGGRVSLIRGASPGLIEASLACRVWLTWSTARLDMRGRVDWHSSDRLGGTVRRANRARRPPEVALAGVEWRGTLSGGQHSLRIEQTSSGKAVTPG